MFPPAGRLPLRALGLVCLLALAILPLPLAGWLVVGGALLVAIVLEPLAAIYALPFAVAFGSLIPLTAGNLHAGPTDLLVGGLVLAYLLREGEALARAVSDALRAPAQLLGRLRLVWDRDRLRIALFAALLTYLGMIVLSGAGATSRSAVLKEALKWGEVTALVALGLWLLRDLQRVRVLAWAFIAAGVAEALLGYAQWVAASGDPSTGGGDLRVFGTFAQPNPYAGYLNFALALALALVVFGTDLRERWVAAAASILLLGAQLLDASRGGLLGLAAAVVVTLVVGCGRERLAGLIAVVAVPLALIAWFAHLLPARIQTSLLSAFRVDGATVCGQVNARTFSTVERLAHWLAGIRMFQAHPLLGVGAGNYDAAYARYACPDWPESLGHAHNYYINAAAETGLLGLVAFLAVTALALYLGWLAAHRWLLLRHLHQPASDDTPPGPAVPAFALAVGFFAVLAALSIHNLTDDLFVHAMELQVALSIACLFRLLAARERNA